MGIPGGGGERVLDQYLNTGLKPGAFLGQKILKYKRCLGHHSPRLVLKSFISHCNRVNSCDSHFFCILSCSADNRPFPHYAPVSKHKEMKTRLGWTISYKSLYFVHPSLELVPLSTGMRERSITNFIKQVKP